MYTSRRDFVAASAWALCTSGAVRSKAETAKSAAAPASKQQEPLKTVCDYGASYITFVTPGRGNLARLQVESRLLLMSAEGELIDEFFGFASCKAEHTHAKQNLFQDPNYDFSGVFSRQDYVIFRAAAPQPRTYAERGAVRDRFDDLLFQIRPVSNVNNLSTNADIVRATLDGRPLIGRTELSDPTTGQWAVLEYPVKTMNVNDLKGIYQVDTGPLAFPDLTVDAGSAIDRLELAYVAYNSPSEAYFVIQRVTAIKKDGQEVCRVCHYSEIRRMPAKNTLMPIAG